MSSADLKCPVCSRTLEPTEHDHAVKQLERGFLQKYRDRLAKVKQEHADRLAKFKDDQSKKMQDMAKKGKENAKRELVQLKKNYQVQLAQMREFYSAQNAALQNELKASFAGQLEGMKKNYEGLSASNQRQLETIQKYVEDKVVGELKEKIDQLEQDKVSAELRLAELVQDLDRRNSEVVSLKGQLRHLGGGDTEEKSTNEAPEHGNDQELIKIAREVAQEQDLGDLKELEDDHRQEEKHGFWGQRKKFSLF